MNIISKDTELDISWLTEQNKIQSIQKKYQREPIENINVYSIFINKNNYIERINHSKMNARVLKHVDNENKIPVSGLPREEVMQIIQDGKNKNFGTLSKYKFSEILTFCVDLEPDNVQLFSQSTPSNSPSFFNITNQISDIVIPDSIYIFHEINSIYFIFNEDVENPGSHRTTVKSILKTSNNKTKHKLRSPKSVTMNIRDKHNKLHQRRHKVTKKKRITIHK